MAEHDDALLDEDFASLPDISDEENELDFNNDDSTISIQESVNEELSCDLQSSLEDILDLTDLDASEEHENNVVELESNSILIENVKQENRSISPSSKELEVESNNEDTSSVDDTDLVDNNNSHSESRFKTVSQCEPNVQEHESFCVNNSEYQQNQSTEKECGSRQFDRVSNVNCSYTQPINEFFGPSVHQSCYNLQDQRMNVGLNRSFFNEPPVHEPYSIDHLAHQSVFWYNSNSYANNGYHPPMSRSMYHSAYQSPPFTNQILPIQHNIQMLHSQVPMMRNTCQPFFFDSNRQMLNSQNSSPNYFDSTRHHHLARDSQDQPQYVLNPLYKQNQSNKQKVLINRHFTQTEARKHYLLKNDSQKADLFLKKITFQNINNQHWKNRSQSTNDMDPYSYFSDIWQPKGDDRTNNNQSLQSSLSPETLTVQNQKRKLEKDQSHQQEKKRVKTCKTKTLSSITTKPPNIRTNMKFKRNCKRKRRNHEQRWESLDDSKKVVTSKEKRKEVPDIKIKKEEVMDPEMVEYCKKIEEQKRRRDKFLQIKETRRKLLAMEKTGIKSEPIEDNFL